LLGEASILVPMAGLIDVSAELARLRKKRDRLDVDLKRSEGKLSNDKFVANAPDDVVTRERQRVEDVRGAIAKIEQQMATMASLAGS
jgi:valyl-tRNA synthetase